MQISTPFSFVLCFVSGGWLLWGSGAVWFGHAYEDIWLWEVVLLI